MAQGEDEPPRSGPDETGSISPESTLPVPEGTVEIPAAAPRGSETQPYQAPSGSGASSTGPALPPTAPPAPARGPRPRREPRFVAGSVLANRYRIVRFIAEGAMGEVYEAEDQALRGRVALKTVQPEIAADAQATERFKREIALARLVTHPNVCRIFDLGLHQAEKAPGDVNGEPDLLFLTMELLSGETLASFIGRRRRLKRTEALPLLRQIAAGLDAAHAVGVVHRDFKSSNVMLVPASDPRKPVRGVVTDFGLARGLDLGDAQASISDPGTVVGTPAYMAPEQVEGLPLTPAADIYSLGIVAYEMIAGVRPFDGGSAITVALRRLKEAPAPPRTHVADIHPAWDSAILRCLRLDPTERFGTASDFVRALETPSTTVDAAEVPTRKMPAPSLSGRRVALWAGVCALAAVIAGVFYIGRSPEPEAVRPKASSPAPVAAPVTRRSVAVLGFSNLTKANDAAWLGLALAEMLTTDLSSGGGLRAIPRADVAAVARDLPASGGDLGKESASAFRRALGADLVVTGSYTLTGGPPVRLLRVDARVVDASSGETLAQGSSTGNEGQLFDIVYRAASPLREKLGLGRVAPAQALEIEAVLPANPEAARLYSRGLLRLRSSDPQAAVQDLSEAARLAPTHPLVRSALAETWQALGYDQKARAEARRATSLGGALPGELRGVIDAAARVAEKDWDGAAAAYAGLAARFPDEPDYRLRAADAQTRGGKPKEALAALSALRAAMPSLAEDPRLDLLEARVNQELGSPKEALNLAESAARKAEARGLRVAKARALGLAATALYNQGQPKVATERAEESLALYEASGERSGAARALEQIANSVYAEGDLRGAERLYARALAAHREIGDVGSVARVLTLMANDSFLAGDLATAQRLYDEALVAFTKVEAKYEAAATLSNLGARLQVAGQLPAAQRRYQQALGLFQEIGERGGIATTLTNLGEVFFARGDLKRSQQLLEEALALYRGTGDHAGAGYCLFRLGEAFLEAGDLGVAADRLKEAERLQEAAADKLGVALTRVARAHVARASGEPGDAEKLARSAEEVLRVEGAKDGEAGALLALAETLLDRKDLAGARDATARATTLLEKSEDQRLRLEGAVFAARLRAASQEAEDVSAAMAAIEAALQEATKSGIVPCQYTARLGLGMVEMAAERKTEGRARLRALAAESKGRGFILVSRRAAAAAS